MEEITLRQIQSFDEKQVTKRICAFIERIFRKSGKEKVIVGLSGGVDSSLMTKLLVEAIGSNKVVGFFLPDKVTSKRDEQDARKLAKNLGIELREITIDDIITSIIRKLNGKTMSKRTQGNIKARTRMLILYTFSNKLHGLVSGASDRSEWLLGYFTKWGDGAADFFPIKGLYKTQVRKLGRYLDLPRSIIEKPSSPSLWKGQTAKKELSAGYETIDKVFYGFFELDLSQEDLQKATGVSKEKIDEILGRFKSTKHKRSMPPFPEQFCFA